MKDRRSELPPQSREPIFLRATASGAGGIATISIDGNGCISLLEPILQSKRSLRDLPSGELLFARLLDGEQRIADEVIVSLIDPQSSTTGNQQAEISCHGGVGALAAVEEALVAGGLRRGRETELLERAHLNAKLSLIAMEAQIRLADAQTARQADFLLQHAVFQQRWERFGFEMAMGLRTRDLSWREKVFTAAAEDVRQSACAMALLAQQHVVIAGPVNAGKSTLANWLARSERHLVSDIPGTTLDRLDTPVAVRGLTLLLSDTAGLRGTDDAVEREGQARGAQAMTRAALRLIVLDASRAPGDAEMELIGRSRESGEILLVLNKQDLGVDESALGLGFLAGREPIVVSAQTGAGMEVLERAIESILLKGDPAPGNPFTSRQARLLQKLHDELKSGEEGTEIMLHLRRLIGTRPDPDELEQVLS